MSDVVATVISVAFLCVIIGGVIIGIALELRYRQRHTRQHEAIIAQVQKRSDPYAWRDPWETRP